MLNAAAAGIRDMRTNRQCRRPMANSARVGRSGGQHVILELIFSVSRSETLSYMVLLEKEGWETRRDQLVHDVLENKDVAKLTSISALPGGFGTLRKRVWYVRLS